MKKAIALPLALVMLLLIANVRAATFLYPSTTPGSVGLLYTYFKFDNQGLAYRGYYELMGNGTWYLSPNYQNGQLQICQNCSTSDYMDSASQTLHIDRGQMNGFEYNAVLELKPNNPWRLISLEELPVNVNGRWVGSYKGLQIEYMVIQNGASLTILVPGGLIYKGTIVDKTAVVSESTGFMEAQVKVTLLTKDTAGFTVLSCSPPAGYYCAPGVGESMIVHR